MRGRFWISVAVGAVLGGAVVLGFGPCVRAAASRKAAAYGAHLEIRAVAPALRGVRLRGVDVAIDDLPGVSVHVDDMVVGWIDHRPVEMAGGRIQALGTPAELAQSFERWRSRYFTGGSSGDGKSTQINGFELHWQESADDSTRNLSATGLSVARTTEGIRVAAAHLRGVVDGAQLDADNGRLLLAREAGGYRVAELGSDALQLELGPDSASKLGPLGAETTPGPAPATGRGPEPPMPAGSASRKPQPAAALPLDHRVLTAQLLHRALVGLADRARGLLDPDAKTGLSGVRCVLHLGADVLNLGPGTLSFESGDEAFVVVLSPSAASPQAEPAGGAAQALTFSLRIPLAKQAQQGGVPTAPVVAELHGGPVWLSTLGIREGDLGLTDVSRASIEADAKIALPADGHALSIDGRGKLHQLSLSSPRLATEPLRDMELGWRAKAELQLDGSSLRVEEGAVDLGDLHLAASGTYRRAEGSHQLDARFEVPLLPCQQAFDSVPRALLPSLGGMRFAGSLGAKGQMRFDTARLDQTYSLTWDGTNSCRVTEVPQNIAKERFRKPFRKTVYDEHGKPSELDFGPGTPTWAPYGAISRFMEVAVLTTEDGRFPRHHGFDPEAIVNSIRENLRTGHFVRGASTISMQLARNLYLGRERTISRKLQEAVLTLYLEQELTKQEIMELYLNVIEFGPMVYGVGPAAGHYFRTSPGNLSLGQALYLSSILPNPAKQHFGAGGAVSAGYSGILRRLMHNAHKSKRLSDEELEEGLRETVILGSPSPARAPKDASDEPPGAGGAPPEDGTAHDGD